jgi:hypothetical protein
VRQELYWWVFSLHWRCHWAYRPLWWLFFQCNRGRSFYCFRPEDIAAMSDPSIKPLFPGKSWLGG